MKFFVGGFVCIVQKRTRVVIDHADRAVLREGRAVAFSHCHPNRVTLWLELGLDDVGAWFLGTAEEGGVGDCVGVSGLVQRGGMGLGSWEKCSKGEDDCQDDVGNSSVVGFC